MEIYSSAMQMHVCFIFNSNNNNNTFAIDRFSIAKSYLMEILWLRETMMNLKPLKCIIHSASEFSLWANWDKYLRFEKKTMPSVWWGTFDCCWQTKNKLNSFHDYPFISSVKHKPTVGFNSRIFFFCNFWILLQRNKNNLNTTNVCMYVCMHAAIKSNRNPNGNHYNLMHRIQSQSQS